MCHKKSKNTTSLPTVKDCPPKHLLVQSHRNNNTEKSNTEKKTHK